MKYNPQIHHRKSIRLKGYDYSQAGAYFVTICCEHRQCRFGKIEYGKMILNEYGNIAFNEWNKLQERFLNCGFDVFQIMPNHMHGIIVLNTVGASLAGAQNNDDRIIVVGAGVNPAPTTTSMNVTVGNIVGAYKSLVVNGCLKFFKSKNEIIGKLWQRNYYEHIIRNELSYQMISNYIINNPAKWDGDKFNH